MSVIRRLPLLLALAGLAVGAGPNPAGAVVPVVKTVRAAPTSPLVPHETWSGRTVKLKGTSSIGGAGIEYSWDPGDGSPAITGTVGNAYTIEASHAYVGAPGTVYTARLTVTDTATGDNASAPFRVVIRDQVLPVEVNAAIEDGLWYLHKTQVRTPVDGQDAGHWFSGGQAATSYYGIVPSNVLAFEVNGFVENGDPDDPYTETVQRGLRYLFALLITSPTSPQPNPLTPENDTYDPDGNGNGYGVRVNQGLELYQGGMFIDAIVASGAKNSVTVTGPQASGADPGIRGRTYLEIAQDMVDYYSFCQYDFAPGGGWRYGCNEFPDNSANQWAAIGMIPAERNFGVVVPSIVKQWNLAFVQATRQPEGWCGYTGRDGPWGVFATTPSCLVQLALDGVGRGTGTWDGAETYLRDNFANGGGPTNAIKAYYYGLFSFVKSMLLHDSNGDKVGEPITLLASQTAGVPPLDWYAAEVSEGAPTDGVARTLVSQQNPAGSWYNHNYYSDQYPFETGFAIVMLRRTIVDRPPVAVVKAVPNPAEVNVGVLLDCSQSFHLDPARQIVAWAWDLDNDGEFDDATGPTTTTSFPALGDYPVTCRVTDGGDAQGQNVLTDDARVIVDVSIPPLAPTADAGGPYLFCEGRTPWFLDGTGSINPDDGVSEPGQPPDGIQSYDWDLDENGSTDATGPQPDVTAAFQARGPGDYLISLRVTDRTATAFPLSGLGDLSGTATSAVMVRAATDPLCVECSAFTLTAKPANPGTPGVELSWTAQAGASSYNVYRSGVAGGPYSLIGNTAGTGFTDSTATPNVTYYYVVRSAAANGDERCQTNEASAAAQACTVTAMATAGAEGTLRITVTWTAQAGASAYRVYRGTSAGGPYDMIAEVNALAYDDNAVQGGLAYYYVVRALVDDAEVCPSAEVTARVSPLPPPSGCGFEAQTRLRISNQSLVEGNLGVNDQRGKLIIGRDVVLADDTVARGARVVLGVASSVDDVKADSLKTTKKVVIRGTTGPAELPLADPFCPIAAIECGGADVRVSKSSPMTLSPGSYGTISVADGATLNLQPGTYRVCTLKTGWNAAVVIEGDTASTFEVGNEFRIWNGSSFKPVVSAAVPRVIVAGTRVKIGANTDVRAILSAPNAFLRVGRHAQYAGSFCALRAVTGWDAHLSCAGAPAPTTTTTSTTTTTTEEPTTTTEEPTTTTTTEEPTTTTEESTTTTTTEEPTTTTEEATTTTTSEEPTTTTTVIDM